MDDRGIEHDKVREEVSEYYAKAVARSGGCCAGASRDQVAADSGYAADQLARLPDDAVASALGCGNPLGFGEVAPGDVVVELGAGAGIDLIVAGGKVGPRGRVIGVDMTDAMIDRARANVAAAGLANVEVRKGLIEALPVDAGSVDWVVSNCVVNLSPDKPAVFAEIFRVLKPGGRMLISDIVVEDLPDWVRADKVLYSACVAGAISEAEYVAGLGAAGLQAVEVRDRLVYDCCQIEALYRDELADAAPLPDETLRRAAQAVDGKVWSAMFYARKPAA